MTNLLIYGVLAASFMSFSSTTNMMEIPNTRKSFKSKGIFSKVTRAFLYHLALKIRMKIKIRRKRTLMIKNTMSLAEKIKLRSF